MEGEVWLIQNETYTISKHIGEGGFGFVYAAQRDRDRRLLSIFEIIRQDSRFV